MTTTAPSEQEINERFQELCADLNMDGNATDEAWQSFLRISNTYTLEGDSLHWLACALYVACRTTSVPTVNKGSFVEGNCVSLTRLLRSCKLSLVQFFSKMKKWADMANLPKETRDKVDRLERSFNVSTVIFKKFEPIFRDIFKDPFKDPPRPTRSRKQRRLPCTSSEVFSFCWSLFIRVKGNFPAISEDLVNSFHLLLCCVDLMYSNALLAEKKDIMNPNFVGLPPAFGSKEFLVPFEPPCIIELLCNKHQGIPVEAKGIKEHWWKPYIQKLMEKKILKGKLDCLMGLLDTQNFEQNSKAINKEYEEHVLNVGDFDERIFLGENANEEIGTPAKPSLGITELAERMREVKGNLQQHMKETKTLLPSTPLTGRKYLKEKEAAYITPVTTATQSVSRLQALLAGRKPVPSETLQEIFKECNENPEQKILARVKEMGEAFCTFYAMPSEDHPGSHIEFAKKRLSLGENLYYKALEDIMVLERKRLPPKTDFSNMLDLEAFHRSLFACCLEIVIFSYNSQRSFPWVLQIFNLQPYYFYKVIELLIRAEDSLSRDVVKHLNHIEEQILENLAWKTESPLWNAIKTSGLSVPSCEDVSLPRPPNCSTVHPSQLVSSPLAHPAVRRVTNNGKNPQSPIGLSERFQSPAPAAMTSARRRLFAASTSNTTPTSGQITLAIPQQTVNHVSTNDTTVINSNPIMSPARNVTIILQQVQNDTLLPTTQIIRSPITHTNQTSCIKTPVTSSGLVVTPQTTQTIQVVTTSSSSCSIVRATPSETMNRPKRAGSLGLFFRKVYHLAGVRLKELCDRLSVFDDELKRKIWTCFEYSLMQHIDLMRDRHLDQLLMCAVYVICKVTKEDRSFQEIMKYYRLQPQAASHVYRSVLLVSKGSRKRRHSGSSETSKDDSGSNSPIPSEGSKDEGNNEKESKRTEHLSTIRSSSTLPIPHPSSQPPTPTKLAGTGTHFEFEERGDLINFYNKVYVPKIQKFAYKFSQTNNGLESPPLSPLPRLNANPQSPWRRVSNKHSVYIAPLTNTNFPPSPGKPLSCCFNKSPAKDFRAINNFVKREKKVGKRILQEDSDNENPPKHLCEELTLQKIQSIITDREGKDGSNGNNSMNNNGVANNGIAE